MAGQRLHSMDALRASTMLLLVPAHAAILLSVNGHGGAWSSAVLWVIHVFRLPLFFAMGGLFGVLLARRDGLARATRNRLLRVGLPLAVGVITLVPIYGALANATGVAITADGNPAYVLPLAPSYLWFLWYLAILYAAAGLCSALAPRLTRRFGTALVAALRRSPGVLAAVLGTAAVLWPNPEWQTPPPAGFTPDLPILGYYAIFFCFGCALATNPGLPRAMERNGWRWFGAAAIVAVPAALLYSLHNEGGSGAPTALHAAALLLLAAATWTSLFALIGLARRYLSARPHPGIRYIADSSYWIYLTHLQVMVLVMAVLLKTMLPTAALFGLIVSITCAVTLAMYAALVRYSFIGWVLHGPRRRPTPAPVGSLTRPAAAASPPA